MAWEVPERGKWRLVLGWSRLLHGCCNLHRSSRGRLFVQVHSLLFFPLDKLLSMARSCPPFACRTLSGEFMPRRSSWGLIKLGLVECAAGGPWP